MVAIMYHRGNVPFTIMYHKFCRDNVLRDNVGRDNSGFPRPGAACRWALDGPPDGPLDGPPDAPLDGTPNAPLDGPPDGRGSARTQIFGNCLGIFFGGEGAIFENPEGGQSKARRQAGSGRVSDGRKKNRASALGEGPPPPNGGGQQLGRGAKAG